MSLAKQELPALDSVYPGLGLPPFAEIGEGYLPDNAHVHVHLSAHGTEEHFAPVEPQLQQADIFIPESAGWSESSLRWANAISKGERKTVAEALEMHTGFSLAMVRALRGRYIPVAFIDAPASRKDMLTLEHFDRAKLEALSSRNLETALDNSAEILKVSAKIIALRDRIMIESLGPTVTKIVSNHPKLKNKEAVRVLCTIGSLHEDVYDRLAASPHTAQQVSGSTGLEPLERTQAGNLVDRFQRDLPVTRSDLLKIMVRQLLSEIDFPDFTEAAPVARQKVLHQMRDGIESNLDNADVILALDRVVRKVQKPEDVELFTRYANQT
jgi:hypothetical protein